MTFQASLSLRSFLHSHRLCLRSFELLDKETNILIWLLFMDCKTAQDAWFSMVYQTYSQWTNICFIFHMLIQLISLLKLPLISILVQVLQSNMPNPLSKTSPPITPTKRRIRIIAIAPYSNTVTILNPPVQNGEHQS